ncbi:XRE family transcriptional regulator [Clostridiaceae bacterium]|jgi:transcriptional regulator with XRE-family HTH domain|nr:XRE family transcriptional regulator [Clostridiaceae bacterium]
MNGRIKELRETLKLSQSDFADMLNLKRNSISLIEVGKRNPSDRTILDICQKFSVSEDWLRTGAGEMFSKTPSGTMEQLKKEFDLDDFSFNLVYEYLKLAPAQREKVRDFFYRVIDSEENIDYIAEAPRTPGDLEKQFPPAKKPDEGTKTG